MMLIDSHCHLDFPDFAENIDAIVANARAAGVGRMITIGTRIAAAHGPRAIAERFDEVWFSVGTHPHNADQEADTTVSDLLALANHPRCVAIGEAGLDYHYDRCDRAIAERVFRVHCAAARASGLPLVIHSRDADSDMARILRDEMGKGPFKALLHCFTAGEDLAATALELGMLISFSGVLTYKSSDRLRAIAETLPMDRLLVETDAPYLAPVPYRGKPNAPALVVHTAAALARCKGVGLDEIARATTDNALRAFSKLPSRSSAEER